MRECLQLSAPDTAASADCVSAGTVIRNPLKCPTTNRCEAISLLPQQEDAAQCRLPFAAGSTRTGPFENLPVSAAPLRP